ncbi:MAG TPA: hypothetical protein VIN34_00200 [Candidatus Limnocylindria bacterium]
MAGTSRTLFIDAASGRLLRTSDGISVVAWFADGRMLLMRWSATESDPRRQPDPAIELIAADGTTLRRITFGVLLGISPDGRWLLSTGEDRQHPRLRLVEIATGRAVDLPVAWSSTAWTPSGKIAVVTSAAPR